MSLDMPITWAPSWYSQRLNQEPLKPVFPVMIIFLPLKILLNMSEISLRLAFLWNQHHGTPHTFCIVIIVFFIFYPLTRVYPEGIIIVIGQEITNGVVFFGCM